MDTVELGVDRCTARFAVCHVCQKEFDNYWTGDRDLYINRYNGSNNIQSNIHVCDDCFRYVFLNGCEEYDKTLLIESGHFVFTDDGTVVEIERPGNNYCLVRRGCSQGNVEFMETSRIYYQTSKPAYWD